MSRISRLIHKMRRRDRAQEKELASRHAYCAICNAYIWKSESQLHSDYPDRFYCKHHILITTAMWNECVRGIGNRY